MLDRRAAMEREKATGHRWNVVRPERWEAIERTSADSVLDVGCSGGAYVRLLRERGVRAVGLDLLPDVEWTAHRAPFLGGDALALPFSSKAFDAVAAFEVLEHVPDVDAALAEWQRVARRHVVLSVPNCEQPDWAAASGLTYYHYVDRTHCNFFTAETLRDRLNQHGFCHVSVEPIFPVKAFVPALDALGLPSRIAAGVGRRLDRFSRRQWCATLLALARVP